MRNSVRVVKITKPIPLVGHIAFGIIDRGTNILQVRPTSLCNLNCIFCSVDAGPFTHWRKTEYVIDDAEWLAEWVIEIAKFKGGHVEALIDGVGDPFTYSKLPELISLLRSSNHINSIAIETHGQFLNKELINKLANAGLDRINLSIDTTDQEQAKILAGTSTYDVMNVMKMTEYIIKETPIDVTLVPLWLPGINDNEIMKIIEWGMKIGVGKKWPPFAVQKYLTHKYGRKIKSVKEVSWDDFYNWLHLLEKKYKVKLIPDPKDFGFEKRPTLPILYEKNSTINVEIIAPGWLKNEWIGIPKNKNRIITVISKEQLEEEQKVNARIISNKDNIYIAQLL
ncbi:MAG: radical SAM protein [Thermoprotei archaeon]